MTPIVFKIFVMDVEIHINGIWETKHRTRQDIDAVGNAIAVKLGGEFLHFIEQGVKHD